ncbi:hypothetical protein ACFQT0_02955 [Hymenobacter humi]|uniref:Uncharacterized protein n=1 Tax=Hymenobacter humi TaxID=1411620 RepID=A0ABW2TZ46_9BACT
MPATLYLIPTPLADDTAPQVLPPQVVTAVGTLPYFLVENARTARRFVKSVAPTASSRTFASPSSTKTAPTRRCVRPWYRW